MNLEPYIELARKGAKPSEVIKAMAKGLGIKETTAKRYYYGKVRHLATIERSDDIPPVWMQDTTKRVRFSEEEKRRIREEAGVYLDGEGKRKYFNPSKNRKGI